MAQRVMALQKQKLTVSIAKALTVSIARAKTTENYWIVLLPLLTLRPNGPALSREKPAVSRPGSD